MSEELLKSTVAAVKAALDAQPEQFPETGRGPRSTELWFTSKGGETVVLTVQIRRLS